MGGGRRWTTRADQGSVQPAESRQRCRDRHFGCGLSAQIRGDAHDVPGAESFHRSIEHRLVTCHQDDVGAFVHQLRQWPGRARVMPPVTTRQRPRRPRSMPPCCLSLARLVHQRVAATP